MLRRGGGGAGAPDLGGFALVINSALCYSTLGVFAKIAFASQMRLGPLLATRFTLAAACLWAMVLLSPGGRAAIPRLDRRHALALLVCGIFGYAGQAAIFFSALRWISASLTVVLLYTCPAFLALIVWGTTGRRPGGARLAAIALAMGGTYLSAAPRLGGEGAAGAALAVLAGLWYACFLLLLYRLTPGVPGLVSGALVITGAAIAFDAAVLATGDYAPPADAPQWMAILGLVVVSTLMSFVLFINGLKRVGPQVASILSTFEPLGTLLIAAIVLGERLTATQSAGAALVIGAAFVLATTAAGAARPAGPAPMVAGASSSGGADASAGGAAAAVPD
ncbi:MAG: DMT family transporter [Acidobacteriota bacterium]